MTNYEITEIIIGCVILFIVILPLYNTPSVMRSRRIARIAQEFGLSFSKGSNFFNPFQSYRSKANIVSGTLNGHTIEAYDNQMMLIMPVGPEFVGSFRKWVLMVDGVRRPVPYAGRFFGLRMPTHKIHDFLSAIS